MKKTNVLFVCVHNSARSQMAEAFLNTLDGDRFHAESAGLKPGELNPLSVEAMKEEGIDISGNKTKSAFEFYKRRKAFDYVITVCDESSGEKCPTFPGNCRKLHWSLEDPSGLHGAYEEQLDKIRAIRDKIKIKVDELIKWQSR